jgi:hypothetical protein
LGQSRTTSKGEPLQLMPTVAVVSTAAPERVSTESKLVFDTL